MSPGEHSADAACVTFFANPNNSLDACGRGEPVAPYQTFREGSQYQQLIDIIRRNDNWVDVSHLN